MNYCVSISDHCGTGGEALYDSEQLDYLLESGYFTVVDYVIFIESKEQIICSAFEG